MLTRGALSCAALYGLVKLAQVPRSLSHPSDLSSSLDAVPAGRRACRAMLCSKPLTVYGRSPTRLACRCRILASPMLHRHALRLLGRTQHYRLRRQEQQRDARPWHVVQDFTNVEKSLLWELNRPACAPRPVSVRCTDADRRFLIDMMCKAGCTTRRLDSSRSTSFRTVSRTTPSSQGCAVSLQLLHTKSR